MKGFSSFSLGEEGVLIIVLVFHDILKSYLVSIYLLILAISEITGRFKCHVTMATKAGAYNIVVGRYKGFIFGVHIPCGNSNLWYNLLLWIPCYHRNRSRCL